MSEEHMDKLLESLRAEMANAKAQDDERNAASEDEEVVDGEISEPPQEEPEEITLHAGTAAPKKRGRPPKSPRTETTMSSRDEHSIPTKKKEILVDNPIEYLHSIEDKVPELRLRVRRVTPGNNWTIVYSRIFHGTRTLVAGTFEEWLGKMAGGGKFLIECFNSTDNDLLCRFFLSLSGAPKNPRQVDPALLQPEGANGFDASMMQSPGEHSGPNMLGSIEIPAGAHNTPGVEVPRHLGGGVITPPPLDSLPKWAHKSSVVDQWKMYYGTMQESGRLPGTTYNSDLLAVQTGQVFQRREAELREKLDTIIEDNRKRDAEFHRTIADLRESKARDEADAKIASLEARLQKPATDWIGIATALGPIVAPLLMNSISSNKDREMLLLKSMFEKKDDNGPMQMILPLLLENMKSNSPEAQAEAQATKDESRLMMIKFMADQMASQGAPDNPWMPLIQSAIESMAGYMASRQMSAGSPPPRQLPAAHTTPPSDEDRVWETFARADAQAAQQTKLVWERLPPHLGLRTHEWRILLFNMHAKLLPQSLAPMLAKHLVHCRDYQMLPQPFEKVFDSPAEVLTGVMKQLPTLASDEKYIEALSSAVEGFLIEEENVQANGAGEVIEHEEEAEEEEQEDAMVVS